MSGTSTTRLALYKPGTTPTDLVNVTTDLNNNYDKLDNAAGLLACTSSTRPASPFNGQQIRETDTGKVRYWDGAAWQDIISAVAGGIILAGIAVSRAGATTATIQSLVTGDTQPRWSIDTSGKQSWGPGGSTVADTNLYRSAANVLTTDDSLVVAGSASAASVVAGAGTFRTALGTSTTVASSAAETVVGTFSVPANEPVVGAIYKLVLRSNFSFLTGVTATWRIRWGGVAGTLIATMGPTTLGSVQTFKESVLEAYVQVLSIGASGTVWGNLCESRNSTVGTSVGETQLNSSDGPVTVSTTTTNALVVTYQWGTSSSSNTMTAYAQMAREA